MTLTGVLWFFFFVLLIGFIAALAACANALGGWDREIGRHNETKAKLDEERNKLAAVEKALKGEV